MSKIVNETMKLFMINKYIKHKIEVYM